MRMLLEQELGRRTPTINAHCGRTVYLVVGSIVVIASLVHMPFLEEANLKMPIVRLKLGVKA